MRKYLLAIAAILFATCAQAQTLLDWGLKTGANPRTACVWDTSGSCNNFLSSDASAHTAIVLSGSLPTPTTSLIGGVKAINAVTHQFITSIDLTGTPTLAQPAFSDISGSATCAQLPALTGNVTTPAGSCATTIGAAQVTGSMIAATTITASNIANGTITSTQVGTNALAFSNLPQLAALSLLGNSTNAAANMAAVTCAAANSVFNENNGATALQCTSLTSVIDSMAGSTRGSLLERGASGWTIVAPSSTASTLLQSNGSGADPGYTTLGQIKGETSNGNASAGNIGEYVVSQVLTPGSSITNNTAADITSISLTAGDWDVEGVVCAAYTTGAGTFQAGWVNSVSATRPTAGTLGQTSEGLSLSTGSAECFATGAQRFSLSSTTTAFLSILALFPNTATAYGSIRARRAR